MDKERAKEILMVHACCSFANTKNNLCLMCPWNNTGDCENTVINEEVIMEAVNTLEGKDIMRKMKLDDIKISSAFAETTPSEKKMEECRFNWRYYRKQDRYIVVDHNNVLIDGYCMYLVLMEHKEEYADVKISNRRKKRWYRKNTRDWTIPHYRNKPTTYIYGVHPNSNCKKTFMWRVPESWNGWVDNVQIGDTILCQTKHGYAPVVVTKTETFDKCPVEFRVNKVAKREIRRNGCIV